MSDELGNGQELPEGWRKVRLDDSWDVCVLGELAQVAYGLTVNQSRRSSSQTAPYLTVANVIRGSLRLNEVKKIGIQGDDIERYRLKKATYF